MVVIEIDDVSTESGHREMTRGDGIDSVDPSMPYDEFFTKYLRANRPCVLQAQSTDQWPCRQQWRTGNAPNFEYLREVFGSSIAVIADCTKKYYNAQMTSEMSLSEYIDYWIAFRSDNLAGSPVRYLKDWHCAKNHPNIHFYDVPNYFASDWLNEYYTNHPELDDDYMFVYMGPKGTWTPFHADVLSSYSWSANVVGKKRWMLYEPGEENKMRDSHGQLAYDVESETLLDTSTYPNYEEETMKRYEIIQNPGEVVFVPSGWHHQVWNLEDTISVNHNWINGCNVWNVWSSLKRELSAVMREIQDCREMDDWEEHCQLMLRASHGMNYQDFYKLLSFVGERRSKLLSPENDRVPVSGSGECILGRNHCLFDIGRIKGVLADLEEDARAKDISSIVFPDTYEARRLTKESNEMN